MAATNPRRSTKVMSSQMTSSSTPSGISTSTRSLRKGATFHSPPTSPLSERPFNIPSLPRRSETTLDDVIDAHKRRMELTLEEIDRSFSSLTVGPPSSSDTSVPVSSAVLNNTVASPSRFPPAMTNNITEEQSSEGRTLRPRRQIRRIPSHKYSDTESDMSASDRLSTSTGATSVTSSHLKTSIMASTPMRNTAPRMSARANNKIHEHVLRPLLSKASLKDFHPIVKDCPRRIHNKEIVCLRDLEKTLIFMAPERSKSAELYLEFCITSIRCIQATVEFLGEREQTRPTDRPYTNGYFIDLVDQIKSYAQQVSSAKEKETKGEALGEMDPQATEQIKLYGGLTRNGRPAELVRVKANGEAISIATGLPIKMESIEEDEKGGIMMKRSHSMDEDDDESVFRSMARRKRSASAQPPPPKVCSEPGCNKEFARSCDLTKHEKTHSRPWKCSDKDCKYHDYGWPTEKELDRHVNDKHAAAPKLYTCLYPPCPYKSKRESNCKQHMEKAHGWQYVRTKNNGKKTVSVDGSAKAKSKVKAALPTPQTLNNPTPESDVYQWSPSSGEEDEVMTFNDYQPANIDFSAGVFADQNDFPEPLFPAGELTADLNPYMSPASSNHRHNSSTNTSPFVANSNTFNRQSDVPGNMGGDFSLFDEDIYSVNRVILPLTPNHDFLNTNYVDTTFNSFTNQSAQISPAGQGNQMLYTPPSLAEDSFDYYSPADQMDTGDFQLFTSTSNTVLGNNLEGCSMFDASSTFGNLAPSSQEFFATFYNPVEPVIDMDWNNNFGY